MQARLAGLVLAGGHGRRFGGPKAWARLPDGRTFLTACCDCLARAGAAPVVATLPAGSTGSCPPGVASCRLPAADLPMFESLRLGLEVACAAALWDVVVVVPGDHPLVRPDTVRALAKPGHGAALPVRSGKRGHPVALSHRLALGIATGAIQGPTLHHVISREGWTEVPVDDPGIHANCNTPVALAAALQAREKAGS